MSVAGDRGQWRVTRCPYLSKSHPEGSEDSARSIRVRTHRRVYHVKVACSTERVSLMAWCFGEAPYLRVVVVVGRVEGSCLHKCGFRSALKSVSIKLDTLTTHFSVVIFRGRR
jgi:hypothetical protein